MTIKEFCLRAKGCGSCVFFPICVWNDKNPQKWDKLTIMTITDAVIKTAEQLQKDDNT